MASDPRIGINELTMLAHSVGQRNCAGAPLGAQNPSYDAHLALRLLNAAQEVMQRVVDDPSRQEVMAKLMPGMSRTPVPARTVKS